MFAQRKSKSSSNPLGFQKPCPNPEIARNLSVVRDRKPSSNQLEQKGMFICSRNVKMSWFQEWWYPGAQIMSPPCFSSHPSSVIQNDIYLVVANPPLQAIAPMSSAALMERDFLSCLFQGNSQDCFGFASLVRMSIPEPVPEVWV